MKATLNLRFDKRIIEEAKNYAKKEKTSVSEIVETYLKKLTSINKKQKYESDKLIGIISENANNSEEDLRSEYFKEKHGA